MTIDKIELQNLLTNAINQEKVDELMTSLAQSWRHEGMLEVVTKGKAEIIGMMIKNGYSVEIISKLTSLPLYEIEKLKL